EKIGEESARIFASRVINLGDKILNCKVYYIISNVETAEEIMSTPFEFSLLPDNSKKVKFLLNEPLDPGRYTIAAILDYGHQDELEGIQMDFEVK
ncbi:MAG: hypothetical protein K0B08_09645, partial [Bacteroidales bacterium]|nr:hypothetical protein [Bacteroidales bacterium]